MSLVKKYGREYRFEEEFLLDDLNAWATSQLRTKTKKLTKTIQLSFDSFPFVFPSDLTILIMDYLMPFFRGLLNPPFWKKFQDMQDQETIMAFLGRGTLWFCCHQKFSLQDVDSFVRFLDQEIEQCKEEGLCFVPGEVSSVWPNIVFQSSLCMHVLKIGENAACFRLCTRMPGTRAEKYHYVMAQRDTSVVSQAAVTLIIDTPTCRRFGPFSSLAAALWFAEKISRWL
jgi:hypothetical protein